MLATVASAIFAVGCSSAVATELANGRITVELATDVNGLVTTDQDRVDSISWINSLGINTGNLAANYNSLACGDLEYSWGDSYAENFDLKALFGGVISIWSDKNPGLSGYSRTTGQPSCGTSWAAAVTTGYRLSTRPALNSALAVERHFRFLPAAQSQSGDLRAYIPRMPLAPYRYVILPETDGTIHVYGADKCPGGCALQDWNGTWFADDDGDGNGLAVIRDASSTSPAYVEMDNDEGYINGLQVGANVTSISESAPAGGFSGTLVETEWLCFYDKVSWPPARRIQGYLPKGCKVPAVANSRVRSKS